MKRLLLAATSFFLIASDVAVAQQVQQRPVPPGRPGGPQIQPPRPGGPQIQPPRPGRPDIQPPRPGRPEIQPPRPGRPGVRPPIPRPPHRPGAGRPPNFRPIHAPGYRYPRGWAYRRWVVGRLLPRLFLSNTYYYNDWGRLGVGAPPAGMRWVRYGPDLLLVRGRDARIVDIVYGAFY